MLSFFTGLLTVSLVFLSLFIIILVLIQRTSGGLGSPLGGSAESAFGGQAGNVLTKTTIYCTVIFFVLTFGLFLIFMARGHKPSKQGSLPTIEAKQEITAGSLTQLEEGTSLD